MLVGNVLWEIHCVSRMNQKEMAKELDCAPITVSRLMKDMHEPSPDIVKNIMRMLKKYKIKSELKFEDFF